MIAQVLTLDVCCKSDHKLIPTYFIPIIISRIIRDIYVGNSSYYYIYTLYSLPDNNSILSSLITSCITILILLKSNKLIIYNKRRDLRDKIKYKKSYNKR